ncbi:3-hydroxyacyl-CoA dehydrogenase NAD-binding domain-containing protein [Shinella sumterensis]|uniref:3-hydroxyacyl-CoA dehydrogenase NAD-binding domain-containing protein n=1 Tax=Shinella sumterensis TaxID=1967501 RepID=A0AA50HHS8_9HYPH|nr:3-hydroxyacyl-CoA dehydrogenase NAD-binding domain-containing protein [Shinella sumterensis]WLS01079.1 3-hydroxyacyl-CoA dehydrogenase NAD-binding domain-containing protein [Shinella sumterensis]WLS11735.1 3-hydroxyacyl-CoA dehydrogenase NAD-binding domain-containing protein [Shinella sumterensis]
MKAAIIGGGIIGGGWAARLALNGWDVTVYDKSSRAIERLHQVVSTAREFMPQLYDVALPAEGTITVCESIKDAVADADWVQESVPERIDIKVEVLSAISLASRSDALLASSTSGLLPSALAENLPNRERFVVVHPFNPVYLLPLVEVVPSQWTSEDIVSRAADTLRQLGMRPLILRREIDGFVANRLQEAIWRESLWMLRDGVATIAEIDDAVKFGFGLRTAQMGQFETFRIAGGEGGMAHYLAHFGPLLAAPWSHLTNVPDLDDNLIQQIATQSDEQCGHLSIGELERLRDENLVSIIRSLKPSRSGAGDTAVLHDQLLSKKR